MSTPIVKRPRPYRDFLTPALHKQFTRAGGLAFVLCYCEAIWMGQWNNFIWAWFPVGPTGARTMMLSISVLLVMIIRISRLHVGRRTSVTPFETFKGNLFAFSTYVTFAWYIVSALLFAEIYVWARPNEEGFGVINHGRAHERARLNERAVAFRTLFILLGVVQSIVHLSSDRDKVPAPTRKVRVDSKFTPTIQPVDSPTTILKAAIPPIIRRLAWTATAFPIVGFLLYALTPLRGIAWRISFDTLRFIYFIPTKQRDHYTGFAPIVPFLWAVFIQGVLLILLWEFTNAAFSAYISQPPLRKEQPLTSDPKAKDPNGSLIAGLKGKKEFARASAFHELLLITIRFPERRQSIYAEIDRTGGTTWSQISQLCLAQITSINGRIAATKPAPPPPTQPADAIKSREPITAPLKQDNIFASGAPLAMGTPARTGEWAASISKSVVAKYGNSPGARPVQDLASYVGKKALSAEQRAALQPQALKQEAQGMWQTFLASPVGYVFKAEPGNAVVGVICGAPYSAASTIIDAIDALTQLVVCSIKEDKYGSVASDVATIIRTYLSTLSAIEDFAGPAGLQIREVELIVLALRDGLGGIQGAFAEYMSSLGLEAGEIKNVRGIVGARQQVLHAERERAERRKLKRREMEEVR